MGRSDLSRPFEESDPIRRAELFTAAESDTRTIREYQPAYILSLLRTRAYAGHDAPPGDVTAASDLERRMRRQQVLDDPRVEFDLILGEAALYWAVGGSSTMVEQLDHLVDVDAARPNVTLRIVPLGAPVDFFIGHAFHLYDSEVVVGTRSHVYRSSDPVTVKDYARLFARLVDVSVSGAEANAIIRRSRTRFQ